MGFGDKKDKDATGASGHTDDQGGFLPDLMRRAVERSVNAVLQGDEERKKLFAAIIPKELVHTVVQTALQAVDGTKREAVEMVGREMQQFLHQLNISEEIRKVLTSVSFEIKTEVRFVPNADGTLRTEVKGGATPKFRATKKKSAKKPAKRASGQAAKQQAPAVGQSMPGTFSDAVSDAMAGTRQRVRNVVDRIAERTADLAELAVGDEE